MFFFLIFEVFESEKISVSNESGTCGLECVCCGKVCHKGAQLRRGYLLDEIAIRDI